MIGCDVPEAHFSDDCRLGSGKQAFAVKSPFGWVIRGPIGWSDLTKLNVNSLTSSLSAHELVMQVDERAFDAVDDDDHRSSLEDDTSLKHAKKSAENVDGHYELSIPRRNHADEVLYNRNGAVFRLRSLQNESNTNPDLQKCRHKQGSSLLPEGCCNGRVLFSPRRYEPTASRQDRSDLTMCHQMLRFFVE